MTPIHRVNTPHSIEISSTSNRFGSASPSSEIVLIPCSSFRNFAARPSKPVGVSRQTSDSVSENVVHSPFERPFGCQSSDDNARGDG